MHGLPEYCSTFQRIFSVSTLFSVVYLIEVLAYFVSKHYIMPFMQSPNQMFNGPSFPFHSMLTDDWNRLYGCEWPYFDIMQTISYSAHGYMAPRCSEQVISYIVKQLTLVFSSLSPGCNSLDMALFSIYLPHHWCYRIFSMFGNYTLHNPKHACYTSPCMAILN